MLEFRPLRLEDLPNLRRFFGRSHSRACDTTIGTIFMWRDMYQTEYAIADDTLYFKVFYPELGETFPLPLGQDRDAQFHNIAQYCCHRHMPISFFPVPKHEIETLHQVFPLNAVTATRDSFDYLYRAEDLQFFRGKKLSGQRNHVNKFLKTYHDWTFRPIAEEDIPAVKAFLTRYAAQWAKQSASFLEDIAKTNEVLDHFQFYGLLGGILLVEDHIVGFSLGEVMGDTLFTHIEKADREYAGCYQMLVSQFAQQFAVEGVDFINREDDAGDPGLRTSKLSYQPVALLEKHKFIVDEPCKF